MITEKWKPFNKEDFPHEWTHVFEEGSSKMERQQWLQDIMDWAQLHGTELVINESANGVELGFKRVEHMTSFVLGHYGNLESMGNHTHTQEFPDATEPDAYFMQAAEAYLSSMGIEFTKEVNSNEVSYAFNNFADRANFQWLIENGAIDYMAHQLREVEAFDREFLQVKQEVDTAFELHR